MPDSILEQLEDYTDIDNSGLEDHYDIDESYVEDFEEDPEEPQEGATEEGSEVEDPEETSEEDPEEEAPEEDPEEEAPEEDPDESLFEIEINGEVYEVNEEELRAGYLRNEQLVTKATELEDEYSRRFEEVTKYQNQLLQELERVALESGVALQKYRNLDWDTLERENPDGYKEAVVAYHALQRKAQGEQERRDQLQSIHNKAQALQLQAYVDSQKKLAETLIPEFKEEGFGDRLVSYGKSIGFTEDVVRGITDAKMLFVLDQARKFSEFQVRANSAKRKVAEPLPTVVKSSAKPSRNAEEVVSRKAARQRLHNNRDMDSAAAVLIDFI